MNTHSRTVRTLPALILVLGLVTMWAPRPAFAAAPLLGSLFQLDGNPQYGGGPCTADDWNRLLTASPNPVLNPANALPISPACTGSGSPTPFLPGGRTYIFDNVGPNSGGNDTTFFTGGGSKDVNDIPQWQWTPTPNPQTPDKDDIVDAFAGAYTFQGDTIVTFGSTRFANNGDANQSFWFTREAVGPVGTTGGGFTGKHENGDILAQVSYTGSGQVGSVTIFEWLNGALVQKASIANPTCSASSTVACAISDTAAQPALTLNYRPKSGTTGQYPVGSFLEGAIDVTQIFAGTGQQFCASSFLAETRSSSSSSAQLKDFAGGSFPLCSGNIQINPPTPTNEVGQPETFTVHMNLVNAGSTSNAAGAAVTTKITGDTTGGAHMTGGTCGAASGTSGSGTTNASGDCTVTIVSPSAGKVTVSATGTISGVGTFTTDGTGTNSSPAVKTYVDAGISLSPLTKTNEVNSPHTITATVKQDDGSTACHNFACNAPDGTPVTFTLLNNTAGATFVGGVSSCTTSGGSCSIQINTSTAGSVDIHAVTQFSVGGVSLTRATDGGGNLPNSGNANKLYVDANIGLSPLSADNSVGSAHTITATVQQDDGKAANANGGDACTGFCPAPNGTSVTFSLPSNPAGASFVGGVNSCTISNNLGTCTVQINSNTPGSVTIHATTSFNVGGLLLTRATGDGLSGDSSNAVKRYHAGSIKITKTVEVGVLTAAPNVCFTLARTDGTLILQSGEQAQQCFAAWTSGNNSHVFQWDGLATGTYSITESVPFPYAAMSPNPITGISVNANSSDPPTVDEGTVSNPLPKGQLQIQKNINGALAPVNGDQFSFTYAYCGADASCAHPGAPVSLKVPGCQVNDPTPQPTSGCSNQNPVLVANLLEGYYQITEQQPSPTSPYQIDPATTNPQVVAVYAANNSSDPGNTHSVPTATFNNVKLYKLILVACDMKDNLTPTNATLTKPDSSVVGPKTTLSSGSYGSFTDSQLCEIPGANFGSLVTGSYTLNIASLPNP